jgi:hypothetical protein
MPSVPLGGNQKNIFHMKYLKKQPNLPESIIETHIFVSTFFTIFSRSDQSVYIIGEPVLSFSWTVPPQAARRH